MTKFFFLYFFASLFFISLPCSHIICCLLFMYERTPKDIVCIILIGVLTWIMCAHLFLYVSAKYYNKKCIQPISSMCIFTNDCIHLQILQYKMGYESGYCDCYICQSDDTLIYMNCSGFFFFSLSLHLFHLIISYKCNYLSLVATWAHLSLWMSSWWHEWWVYFIAL